MVDHHEHSNGTAENCSTVESNADDYVVTSVWGALCLFGLASNTCIVLGVGANQKLRWSVSYWLIVSLSFCDASMLIVCAAHILPLTAGLKTTLDDEFFAQPAYTGHFANAFAIFIYDAFWYSGVLHLMLMALNRYVNICTPSNYARLFSRGKTFAYIWGSYLAGVAVAAPGLHYCCYLVYNKRIYAAQFLNDDSAYFYADLFINAFSVVVMIVCYTKIVVRVRRSRITLDQYKGCFKYPKGRHKDGLGHLVDEPTANYSPHLSSLPQRSHSSTVATSRRELRLLLQFASVSLIFLLSWATWNWLPRLSGSKWVGFVVTTLFYVNNCINPVVYLLFNDALRRQLAPKSSQGLCCCATGTTSTDVDGENAKICACYFEMKRCGLCSGRPTTTLYTVASEGYRRRRSFNGQTTTATRRRISGRRRMTAGVEVAHLKLMSGCGKAPTAAEKPFFDAVVDKQENNERSIHNVTQVTSYPDNIHHNTKLLRRNSNKPDATSDNFKNEPVDSGLEESIISVVVKHGAESGCKKSQKCQLLVASQKRSAVVWSDEIWHPSNQQIQLDSDSCASIHL